MPVRRVNGKLTVVTGPPCAGKTTVAERLRDALRVPLFAKDEVKVALFDTLGWGGREWSKKLDTAVYEVLFHTIAVELGAGRTLIVESNFRPAAHTGRLRALLARCGASAMQVFCRCDPDTIAERFKRRAERGERHPGHRDDLLLAELPRILEPGRYGPMDLGGPVVEVEASGDSPTGFQALFARVGEFLDPRNDPAEQE